MRKSNTFMANAIGGLLYLNERAARYESGGAWTRTRGRSDAMMHFVMTR